MWGFHLCFILKLQAKKKKQIKHGNYKEKICEAFLISYHPID